MQKLIEVRKVYVKTGTGKTGKGYKLWKVLANDSQYYITFNAKLEPILKEGNTIKVECTKGKNEGSFDIQNAELYSDKKDINFDANPIRRNENRAASSTKLVAAPLPIPLTDQDIDNMLKEAKKAISRNFPLLEEDITWDNGLLVALFKAKLIQKEQRFAIEMSRHIQAQKLRNMGIMSGE